MGAHLNIANTVENTESAGSSVPELEIQMLVDKPELAESGALVAVARVREKVAFVVQIHRSHPSRPIYTVYGVGSGGEQRFPAELTPSLAVRLEGGTLGNDQWYPALERPDASHSPWHTSAFSAIRASARNFLSSGSASSEEAA